MKNTHKNPLLAPELRESLAAGDAATLSEFYRCAHPAEIAEFVSALSSEEAWGVLRHAASPLRAEIFSHLDDDLKVEILAALRREEAVGLLTDMPPDDRADLFKQLPEGVQEFILPALAQAEREDIRRLMAYQGHRRCGDDFGLRHAPPS